MNLGHFPPLAQCSSRSLERQEYCQVLMKGTSLQGWCLSDEITYIQMERCDLIFQIPSGHIGSNIQELSENIFMMASRAEQTNREGFIYMHVVAVDWCSLISYIV